MLNRQQESARDFETSGLLEIALPDVNRLSMERMIEDPDFRQGVADHRMG